MVKDLFKRPLFLVLLSALLVLIGVEISTLRFSLAERLISADDAVRNRALSEISGMVPDKRDVLIADLLKAQEHAKPRPKRMALYAVRVAGGKSTAVVNVLVNSLADNDPHVRAEAQTSLLEMGEPVLPSVAVAAKSDNDVAREGALVILEKSGAAGVPFLIPLLKEPAPRALAAVEILGRLGELAKPAVPALIALFDSGDSNLRVQAALAANSIQQPTPEALPVLVQALNNRPWDATSVEIINTLKSMKALAKSASVSLTNHMLRAKESFSDPIAAKPILAQALSELDPRRRELVDLGFDLKQKSPALRYRAAYLLSVMNPPNPGALETIVASLGDADPTVVARLLIALKHIGLDQTERLGADVQAKVGVAAARVKAAGVEGFSDAYGA